MAIPMQGKHTGANMANDIASVLNNLCPN